MKKNLGRSILFVILAAITLMAVTLYSSDTAKTWAMKSVQNIATRHADLLPLAQIGEVIFDRNCASCHDNPDMRAPTREALGKFSRVSLMTTMEFGKMQAMAAHLSKQERGLIAIYLTGSAEEDNTWMESAKCQQEPSGDEQVFVGNWGMGLDNRRFMTTELAGINQENVQSLTLDWSFAFPRVADVRSQPVVVGDTLYIGDKAGVLYALDRRSGCIRNHRKVLTGIRSSITLASLPDGTNYLIFADSLGTVFAVDPDTLAVVWQQSVALFDTSIVTGSISFDRGRLYVPVSSYEVAVAGSAGHRCCQSHGAVLALDASNGAIQWTWHATEAASLQGRNSDGLERYGPSGAVVWTTPTIDRQRNRLYFGTGENLSHPATDTSDAIVALDLDSGELIWKFQATAGDVWNAACLNGGANCPDNAGEDFDFGASVILAKLPDGDDVLLAGQKSGEVFAINPDDGTVHWRNRLSQGTTNGGIHWGMALAGQTVVVPVADPERDREGYQPKPGLYGLDVGTGKVLWQHAVERGCAFSPDNTPLVGLEHTRGGKKQNLDVQYACSYYYGLSSAAMTTPDLAFSGGLDGKIRAFSLSAGEVLWQSETAKAFTTVNGVEGHGGAIDVAGQVAADGWLYVLSGYSMFGQLPGNLLLAYKVEQPLP